METITMVRKSRKTRLKINFTILHKTLENRALGMINPEPIKKPFHQPKNIRWIKIVWDIKLN